MGGGVMRRGLLAIFMLAIFVSSTSSAVLTEDLNPLGDVSKIDGDLIEHFTENEIIEIIVQFKTPMDSSRWNDIDEIGLEKLGEKIYS